jgi:hypothetical protein
MSEHQQSQSTGRGPVSPWQHTGIASELPSQPVSFWIAALASLGLIIGGVGPWATAYSLVSISGTSMHGWREVSVGILGLIMLGLHLVLRARLPLIVAAVAGVLGAIGALATLDKIESGGTVTVFGFSYQYQYLDAAWGLYLVLAGAIALAVSASALAWRVSRAAR